MNATARPSLWQNFILCLTKKYADFSGTSSRREFWGFNLFAFIFAIALSMAGTAIFLLIMPWGEIMAASSQEEIAALVHAHIMPMIIIFQILSLAVYLPVWGVIVRRLRDAGFNTAWGYGYIALSAINLIKWAALDHFQYDATGNIDPITQYLSIVSGAWGLLIIILACFPSKPGPENTPE